MNVNEAILSRRSIRKYENTPIEQEKLDKLLNAVRNAPSAANDQNWKIIVVRDEEKKKLLYDASFNQPWVEEAPCVIILCGTWRRVMDCGQPTDIINPSIAMSFLLLQAHELGLGTCWLGHFKGGMVKAALNIPEEVNVVAMTPLGYPAENPPSKARKDILETVSWDVY